MSLNCPRALFPQGRPSSIAVAAMIASMSDIDTPPAQSTYQPSGRGICHSEEAKRPKNPETARSLFSIISLPSSWNFMSSSVQCFEIGSESISKPLSLLTRGEYFPHFLRYYHHAPIHEFDKIYFRLIFHIIMIMHIIRFVNEVGPQTIDILNTHVIIL